MMTNIVIAFLIIVSDNFLKFSPIISCHGGLYLFVCREMMLRQLLLVRGPAIRFASCVVMTRPLSAFAKHVQNSLPVSAFRHATDIHRSLLPVTFPTSLQTAEYKVKDVLKRRCPKCYWIRRGERLFVECLDKPRHKQMKRMTKRELKLMREN